MEDFDNRESITSFDSVCNILADLWINYKQDKDFADFISYNDMGLPLAYFIDSGLVEPTEVAKGYVEETWNILLESLNIKEDTGWTNLDELFADSGDKE